MYDELELDLVGDRKTVLFFIISDTDATFNFLVNMAYTQLFNLLCERADDKYGGRLLVHVRCLIDEAANIGQIPNLEKLMATIRSREISACLVLQAQSQLKALYKDNMDTIIGNCDASLFLGGKEETTLKSWNSLLGKETIDMYNTSVTKGNQESHGQNFQKLGKDMPYLFVKSWLPKTKINGTGTRSADNSVNHVFFISFHLVQFCTSEKVYKGIMG
jgi:type IV secretion system protein VirD4